MTSTVRTGSATRRGPVRLNGARITKGTCVVLS